MCVWGGRCVCVYICRDEKRVGVQREGVCVCRADAYVVMLTSWSINF